MWAVIGCVVITSLSVAVTVAFVARRAPVPRPPSWDLGDAARKQVVIAGGLSGFAVTGLVLLLGLARDASGSIQGPFAAVVVMFVVAYMSLVASALMYSNLVRSDPDLPADPQAMQYSMATLQFYRGIFLGWIALSPLLASFALDELVSLVNSLLLVAVVGGWMLTSTTLYRLGYLRGRAVPLVPGVALVFTVLWAAGVNLLAPELKSPASLLSMTVLLFAANVVAFGVYTLLPPVAQHPWLGPRLARSWHLASIINGVTSTVLLSFLWMAAAGLV